MGGGPISRKKRYVTHYKAKRKKAKRKKLHEDIDFEGMQAVCLCSDITTRLLNVVGTML